MSLLGIDIGTSGCKASVFSTDGRLLCLAYEEYDYEHPREGWAELDTGMVWAKIKRTIRAAAAGAQADPIQALSVSSLGESFVPVTFDRRILGPSLLNFDARGAEYLPRLAESLDSERLYRINGNTLGNNYALTKMLWMKEHQPELYHQANTFLHWSGFVAFMLGADATVDYSLANRTLLFDLDACDWSGELLALTGIDREKLPPAVPPGKVIGAVSKAVAEELGLPAGALIVSGGHDQSMNGIGCGVIQPGQAMYGMGTYLCMMPVFGRRPEPQAMIARGLNTEHHAGAPSFVSFIYNQGGVIVKWFRDTFAAAEREPARAAGEDIYTRLMSEMPAGLSRVMALPHFTVTGPPAFIDNSSAVIAGLKLETPRGEILKGLLEAMTFYLREPFEELSGAGIQIDSFRAAGGGSKSDAWVQLSADILGRPFMRPVINEAGVMGAAIMAGVGCGAFPSLAAGTETMIKLERTFEPNPAVKAQYDERFELYRQMYPLMRDYLRAIAR